MDLLRVSQRKIDQAAIDSHIAIYGKYNVYQEHLNILAKIDALTNCLCEDLPHDERGKKILLSPPLWKLISFKGSTWHIIHMFSIIATNTDLKQQKK